MPDIVGDGLGSELFDAISATASDVRLAATRARVVARQASSAIVQPLPDRFDSTVVGVSFTAGYPDNLLRLRELAAVALYRDGFDAEPIASVVIRDPDNEHDPNAVQVHVPVLGDGGMIGHLPRAVAARLAPELDGGGRWRSWVTEVRVVPGHEDHPGISVRLARVA